MRVLLAAALLLLVADPSRAEVRVYDLASGAVTTPVRDHTFSLAGWSDDGAALHVTTPGGKAVRVDVASGTAGDLPGSKGADSIGPGGRSIAVTVNGVELRGPDGKPIVTLPSESLFAGEPTVAWSPDGSRVALARSPYIGDASELLVLDTATGAVVLRRAGVDELTPQAFAPDAGALVATGGRRIVRITLPGGGASTLFTARTIYDGAEASWSRDGRIAVTDGRALRIDSKATGVKRASSPLWGADGMLAYVVSIAPDACSYPAEGIGVLAGGRASVLVEPSRRELRRMLWSPDGRRLAVDVGPDFTDRQRGKRRPWPKRVARDYEMFSARGNAAMRRLVLRASRALRRGAGREETLRRVRLDYAKVDRRFDEAGDTAVREAVAEELDRWLIAAGFEPIEALDEITC